jgi:hypothetical protein
VAAQSVSDTNPGAFEAAVSAVILVGSFRISFICYLQIIALGAALMARLSHEGWSRKELRPFLPVFVRFPYYVLLVGSKSNTFLVPRHFNQQQHPSVMDLAAGRTTVRQYLGRSQKNLPETKKNLENALSGASVFANT